jgi:hypothetical protein
MGRVGLGLLLLLAVLVFGAPSMAMLFNMSMGDWSAIGIEQDGSHTEMSFNRNLPVPEWVPVFPDASVIEASHVVNAKQGIDVRMLDIATHRDLAAIKQFCRERLMRAGFAVTDHGVGPMNAPTAAYLGVAGMMSALRKASHDEIAITIRTPEGLFASTLVELRWRKGDGSFARAMASPLRR